MKSYPMQTEKISRTNESKSQHIGAGTGAALSQAGPCSAVGSTKLWVWNSGQGLSLAAPPAVLRGCREGAPFSSVTQGTINAPACRAMGAPASVQLAKHQFPWTRGHCWWQNQHPKALFLSEAPAAPRPPGMSLEFPGKYWEHPHPGQTRSSQQPWGHCPHPRAEPVGLDLQESRSALCLPSHLCPPLILTVQRMCPRSAPPQGTSPRPPSGSSLPSSARALPPKLFSLPKPPHYLFLAMALKKLLRQISSAQCTNSGHDPWWPALSLP